jgi:hypothetical protein
MIMLIVMVTQIIASLKSAINNNLVIKEERRKHSGSCLSLQLDNSVNNRQVVENSNDKRQLQQTKMLVVHRTDTLYRPANEGGR